MSQFSSTLTCILICTNCITCQEEAYRNAVTLTLKIHFLPVSFYVYRLVIVLASPGESCAIQLVEFSSWIEGFGKRTRILVFLWCSCLIWLGQPQKGPTLVGDPSLLPRRRRGKLVRKIFFWRGVIWNFLFGSILTIPVRLRGGVDMCIGCLMRKCSVVTGGQSPSMCRISCLSCNECNCIILTGYERFPSVWSPVQYTFSVP